MKKYYQFLTLACGLLAFFGFALPWKHNSSGAVLANGKGWQITIAFIGSLAILGTGLYTLKRKTQGNSRNIPIALSLAAIGFLSCTVTFIEVVNTALNFITISFIAAGVIIGTSIYMLNRLTPEKSLPNTVVLISSGIGLCCFLILFFGGSLTINSNIRIDNTRYGAFLTAIGYILVFSSQFCYPQTEDVSEPGEEPKDETTPDGDEE